MKDRVPRCGLRYEELEQAFGGAPVGICVVDQQLRFLYINRTLSEAFGLAVQEHLGGKIDDILPDFAAEIRDSLSVLLEPGGSLCEVAIAGNLLGQDVRKDNWLSTLVPWRSGDGRLLAVAAVVQTTGRCMTEGSAPVLDLGDEHQVERSHREAQRSAEAAGLQFLANASHEMRTPLAAIVGFAELMARPDLSAEACAKYLQAVQRNARTLLTLADHILDFSKLESGKLTIEPADCSVWHIVRDALSAIGAAAEQKYLCLDVEYRFPLPELIRTDPLRLWQILVNLLGNAVKFTDRGGVRIDVSLDRPAVDGSRRLRFTVSDTGIGVRPEWKSHLFEPFAQDPAVAAQFCGGVGLGLSIAAKLAELLGGRIELTSRSGSGAVFTFALDPGPLEGRRMLRAEPQDLDDGSFASDSEAVSLHGRILIAEDAPDTLELLRIYLESAGLQVDTATSGLEAVEQALGATSAGRSHDLILMDVHMPKLNGFEVMHLLRASAWKGPIVALSSLTAVEDHQRCREAGFDGYLLKPVTCATLLATVQRFLETGHRAPGRSTPSAESVAQRREAPAWELFDSQLPERLSRLEQCLRNRDRQGLVQIAHQLAGAAGQFGFAPLAEAAQRLEQRASAGGQMRELEKLLHGIQGAALASLEPLECCAVGSPPDTAEKRCHSVLLADDDELVRAGFWKIVDGMAEFCVVAEAENGRAALERTAQTRPEIVLMDIAMPELDGLNATARLTSVWPSVKVVMLSAFVGEAIVVQALEAGASGFLLKSVSPAELERALLAIARGETYFCAAAAQHVVANGGRNARHHGKPAKHLTAQQLEVLKRIAEGDSSKMIARKLGISVRTAEHHRTNLMHSLGIHDTASLVRYAVQMGLVGPSR